MTAHPCPGGVAVSTFKLLVKPANAGTALPVTTVNQIDPGEKLLYKPVHLAPAMKAKAKVAVLLVPTAGTSNQIRILAGKPAATAAEWDVPVRAAVVGIVLGEHGIDEKKINLLVQKNPQLISQLADYAEKTTTVEALVQTLANYEQSAPGSNNLQAVLHGFSSQYNVSLPAMDASTPADQQASQLVRAIVPALSTNNAASSPPSLAQESTGLAGSVGSLFLGAPVTLAMGGAALLETAHTALFPATDFRPAFTQAAAGDGMELCTANQSKKAHTKLDYLWMLRIPNAPAPDISLAKTAHIPLGWESKLQVSAPTIAQLKLIPRARDWRLVSADTQVAIPVQVAVSESSDTLTLDLRKAKLAPGEYKLAASWDWSSLIVAGGVHVHNFADFSTVKLTPESQDRLVAGTGIVSIELTGADFQFLDKVSLRDAAKAKAPAKQVAFTLPKGPEAGEQRTLQAEVDTALLQPGPYYLLLRQVNGSEQKVPVTIHPPNPQLDHLPVRVNLGETEQIVELQGSDLERIERITGDKAEWTLAPAAGHHLKQRQATIKLGADAQRGDLIGANIFVKGLHAPLSVPKTLEVLGPRPKIASIKRSFASTSAVELHDGEIPSASLVSFAVQVDNLDARPSVQLKCNQDRLTKQTLTLLAGSKNGSASLDVAGQGLLFLSVVPGTVGESGCQLMATVSTATTGASDPYVLGQIIGLPRIDKLTISDNKVGNSLYSAILSGQNLQTIDKAGWSAKNGYPVQGIPIPAPGSSVEQTLRITLPWPSPSPHAPLYIWLRGETDARLTHTTD